MFKRITTIFAVIVGFLLAGVFSTPTAATPVQIAAVPIAAPALIEAKRVPQRISFRSSGCVWVSGGRYCFGVYPAPSTVKPKPVVTWYTPGCIIGKTCFPPS